MKSNLPKRNTTTKTTNAHQINIHKKGNNAGEEKKNRDGRKQMFFMTINVSLKSQMQACDICTYSYG